MEHIQHVIDGELVDASDGEVFESVNPWTQEPWAEVAKASKTDVTRAITAARRAFDSGPWPRMGTQERAGILHRLADLIDENTSELALRDTSDMGKPITRTTSKDVPRSALNFRFFADHARQGSSEYLPMDSGHHTYVRYEPAGVFAAIAPWNFPLMLETWKIAPALAWGNTVVLKPAEDTPASAELLGKLALEAGMPAGVLNVIHGHGPDAAGQWLTESPEIDRITFTGESATGRAISRAASANLTPVSLELGGKGASLIFDDADLDLAVRWSVEAIFSNSGQVCLAGSRIYVHRSIYDEFLGRFSKAAEELRPGDPMDQETDFGPLASETHFRKVVGYLDHIPADGGTIVTGGVGDGWFVRPTIAVGLRPDARTVREEIFGPVVVVTPFDDEEEAVRLANDTRYGLNAMVFTEGGRRAHRVSAALRAGTVWVNCFFVRDLRAPFGGVGDSGVGREGGDFSREFCTEPKAVVMDLG